jgi:hypothetical protein
VLPAERPSVFKAAGSYNGAPWRSSGVGELCSRLSKDSICFLANRFLSERSHSIGLAPFQQAALFRAYGPRTPCPNQSQRAGWELMFEKKN